MSEELVFVTETKDKKEEVVKAFDRMNGQLRWEKSWAGSLSVPFFAKENGDWIRATPAYDGKRLYVAGMRDVLVCLDANSGAEQWRVDFVKAFGSPLPAFGFVSSPLIDGDHVFVQAGSACVKLEKGTGKVVWRVLQDSGGMFGSAFASPYLTQLADTRQLLVQTREKLAGLNPGNGDVLWSQNIPAFRGMNILTPTTGGNTVFTSANGGKSLLISVSTEGSKPELKAAEKWTNKATGYMSSPVLINDHIYLHLRNQRFTCISVASGESRWTTRPFGKYWSLVTNGQKILALDERGELLLIRANPEKFELIETRKISEDPTWAHLAVCGDQLFIRELNAIAAYHWKSIP
ncbi:MAG: PQQ-binding-like beta-propeller repeat protein [Planctomycetaceae bacterium]